jgi:DNA-binding SARP family transcriptional activator/tetratricopeptide (TPR) repeat protein
MRRTAHSVELTVQRWGETVEIIFGILGRTVIRIGDTVEEDWAPPKVQALLATLLAHAGRRVPLDTLVEWAWLEEKPLPQNRAATFHTYATRIRKVLQRLPIPSTLHTTNGGFRLEVDKEAIDYHLFRSLAGKARQHARERHSQEAAVFAEQALALWRGHPLDDLSSDRAQAWRTGVERDEWIPVNVILFEALIDLGAADQVLAKLNALPNEHADDIAFARVRMTALHMLSRSSEATTYYLRLRRGLLDDGDEQGAENLREHNERLRARLHETSTGDATPTIEPPRQLPRDISEFVGRADLMRELDAAATTRSGQMNTGVVIIDGMPGVGKSALAVHWAHQVRDRFEDGDFFVNLNGFSDTGMMDHSAVVDDLLAALGNPPDESMNPRARELLLGRLMTNRRTLVVLDNARSSDHVRKLTSLLNHSLIVITSRQRLSSLSTATGARHIQVPPMQASEGTELLTRRLGANIEITDEASRELVARCGGLPLVIAILAGHLVTYHPPPVAHVTKYLDHRRLIAELGEDGDGPSTARTFFSWSYAALPHDEQRLFRLLGLHPGPDIGIEAAASISGRPTAEINRSLGIIVGAHLLERPDFIDRYQFHDLLREFAIFCAERDESPAYVRAAELRMLGHYLASATAAHHKMYPGHMTSPPLPLEKDVVPVQFIDTAHAQRWVNKERANLSSVIHMASAHGHHEHAWRLADTVATFLDRYGQFADSRVIREIAVKAAAAAGDREAEASSQAGLGMVLATLGMPAEARRCLDIALRYAEESGNERGEASTLHQLGMLEMTTGAAGAASELFQRCLDIAQRTGDLEALRWTHISLGKALGALKDHDGALIHLRQSEFHAQRTDRSAHASSLAGIAAVYRDRGDHDSAMSYCRQALALSEDLPDIAVMAEACVTLAEASHAIGDMVTALAYVHQALDVCDRSHMLAEEARAQAVLGNILWARDDAVGAATMWRRALVHYERLGNTAQRAEMQARIAEADGTSRQSSSAEDV